MSMPCSSRSTRTASGWSGLGWLPALRAATAPPDRATVRAAAMGERALLPVQRNRTRAPAAGPAPGAPGASPGWSAVPVAASRSRTRGRSRAYQVSRRSAELRRAETRPADRSRPRWYETTLCGSPTSAVRSWTRRSLRPSSHSRRQRRGWPASWRKASGSSGGGAGASMSARYIEPVRCIKPVRWKLAPSPWLKRVPVSVYPAVVASGGGPFEPVRLGPVTLRNRIVKAATFEGVMPRGAVTDALVDFHVAVAKGGVGLTTLAYCAVSKGGRVSPHTLVFTNDLVPDLRRLTEAVH